MGVCFLGLCLRFGGMRRVIGRRRMGLRRMLRGWMGLGCMLICIARRGMWGMLSIGIGGRVGRLLRAILGWSGRGLWGRCWVGEGSGASKKMRGSLHYAVHDEAVNSSGRDDGS